MNTPNKNKYTNSAHKQLQKEKDTSDELSKN